MTNFEHEMLQGFRQAAENLPPSNGLDAMELMRQSMERQISDLESRLAPHLDAILEGAAVAGRKIDVKFLVDMLGPLQETVTAVGQALDFVATSRAPIPGAVRDVTAMRLAGTFAGSFGVRLEGPEPELQLDLGDEEMTTFERSVEVLFDVIDAADSDDFEPEVRAVMSRMGRRAVNHLRSLTSPFAGSTERMQLRSSFRNQERSTIVADRVATRIVAVADSTEMVDSEVRVRGHLVGASLARKTFELETADETILKGSVGPNVLGYLSRYFDTDCVATLHVTSATSLIDGSESPSYLLLSLE